MKRYSAHRLEELIKIKCPEPPTVAQQIKMWQCLCGSKSSIPSPVQWVKDLAFPQQWLSQSLARDFHMPHVWPWGKKKKKNLTEAAQAAMEVGVQSLTQCSALKDLVYVTAVAQIQTLAQELPRAMTVAIKH